MISHYRVVSLIGRGAMGEVYRAVDVRLGRHVALKLLAPGVETNDEMQQRFLREAQAASALNHPGIVTLYDIGMFEKRLFLVMELVEGESFSQVAERGLSEALALRMCAQAAAALGVAHQNGILHRDVKSDNLMLLRDGHIKVLDFGLAKLQERLQSGVHPALPDVSPQTSLPATREEAVAETLPITQSDSGSRAGLTMLGSLIGSPAYMAPEQAAGREATASSEVFSLGVVLYELLAGKRPFDRDTIEKTLQEVRRAEPEPPERRGGGPVAPEAVAVVMRALAKKPADRWPTMEAFASAANAAADDIGRHRGARRLVFAGAALLAVLAVGFIVFRRSQAAASSPEVVSSRRLTFDPGCEEYPSFLPDGHTIVFDGVVEGDYELQSLDLTSGERRRLTHEPSWDYGAAVSPDGKSVAYLHLAEDGYQARVASFDGERLSVPKILGPASGFPTWSADGGVLVGTLDGRIVRWDAQGKAQSTLATLPEGTTGRFLAALPNQHVVAFLLRAVEDTDAVLDEIVAPNSAREIDAHLTTFQAGMTAAASGDAIYYARPSLAEGNELVRRSLRGEGVVRVTGGLSPRSGFTISRDARHLIFSSCVESMNVVALRPGAAPADLVPRGQWHDTSVARLDDHHLVLTSDRAGQAQIWAFDARSNAMRLLAQNGRLPSPSPDGSRIAYTDAVGGGIHVIAVGGGMPQRLTRRATDYAPAFTHDAASIVFIRSDAGDRAALIPVAGGDERMITPPGAEAIAVSPTEDRIVFLQRVPAGRAVMATNSSGAEPRPLGLPVGEYSSPRFAHDGKRLLLVRKRTEVLEVDLAGKRPPRVLFTATLGAIESVDYAPSGDGLVASLVTWDGDLFLVDGRFP